MITSFFISVFIAVYPINLISVDSSGLYINQQHIGKNEYSKTNILSKLNGDYTYSIDTLRYIRSIECFKKEKTDIVEEFVYPGGYRFAFTNGKLSGIELRESALYSASAYNMSLFSFSENVLINKELSETNCGWMYYHNQQLGPFLFLGGCKEKVAYFMFDHFEPW